MSIKQRYSLLAIKEESRGLTGNPTEAIINGLFSVIETLVRTFYDVFFMITDQIFSILMSILPLIFSIGIFGIVAHLVLKLILFNRMKPYHSPKGIIMAESDEDFLWKADSIASTSEDLDSEQSWEESSPMVYCGSCYQILDDREAIFCFNCGFKLEAN